MTSRAVVVRPSERGFALLLVFLMASAVALMLYIQMPRVAFESERQKEQLLIDRGEQYKRAIQLFRVANNRFPTTLEELEKYQDKRYLRHRYKDPMTGKDEWRVVHTNGMFLTDSQVTKPPGPNDQNKDQLASNGSPGFPGQTPGQVPGQTGIPGQPTGPEEVNAAVAQRPSDRTMPGQTAGTGGTFGNPGFGNPGFGNPVDPNQPQPGSVPPPGFQQGVPQASYSGFPGQGGQQGGDPQQPQQNQNPGQPPFNQAGGNPPGTNPADPFSNNYNSSSTNNNYTNSNSANPASFPPITLYPAGGTQPGAQNNNQQFNPQFPGQPGAPQFPGQTGQPQFPGQTGQPQFPTQVPGQFGGVAQPGGGPPQYRVDATGALVPMAPGPNGGQLPPINLPGQPGGLPTTGRAGVSGTAQPFDPNQVRTPTAPGPVPQQGGAPNQALNLINQLLTTPRQPPSGVTSGQSLGTMQTNGIAGVASTAKGPSIKRYKDRGKYNEWEFVFEVQQPGAPGQPGGQQGPLPGGLPGQQQQPGRTPTPGQPSFGNQPGFPSFIPQNSLPSVPQQSR